MVDYPCLVRLNPNIPWKTRGNGAVCIQLSSTADTQNNTEELKINSDELCEILSRAEKIINDHASLEDHNTNPGIVLSRGALPIDLYWSAVREVVKLAEIKKRLTALGAKFKGIKSGRGIIGASAAIAWASNLKDQNQDFTFEVIAYREPSRWGTTRVIDHETVIELDRRFTSTFNNYDYENRHITIAPHSPCPVFFGVRGDSIDELGEALEFISGSPGIEPIDKWLFFQTNQGTDDHLISTELSKIKPNTSVIVTGIVQQRPTAGLGGHIFFELGDQPRHNNNDAINSADYTPPDSITCAAYEPTKGFRDIVRGLLPGDIVQVYGAVRTKPRTINLEKLRVIELVNHKLKLQNPRCRMCGRAMKSIGYQKGYRCRKCHEKIPADLVALTPIDRQLKPGIYEVPVSARRHLAKPIKRMQMVAGS